MPEKIPKQGNPQPNLYNIILIFIAAFAAPLAAHVCDITMGKENNPLTAEKLLCTYFALIAIYVIYKFLLSFYEKTWLWKKGGKLGNSNALIISTYIIVTTIVLEYYDTLGGTLFVGIIFSLFITILILSPNRIELNSRNMVLFALIVAIIVPVTLINILNFDIFNNPKYLAWIWFVQLIVCIGFDGIYVVTRKLTGTDN